MWRRRSREGSRWLVQSVGTAWVAVAVPGGQAWVVEGPVGQGAGVAAGVVAEEGVLTEQTAGDPVIEEAEAGASEYPGVSSVSTRMGASQRFSLYLYLSRRKTKK